MSSNNIKMNRFVPDVVRHFEDRLTYSDLEEIISYTELWYLGKKIEGCGHVAESTNSNTRVTVCLYFCPGE